MAAASSSTSRSEKAFSEITPYASSTTGGQQSFDVFINHRGPDVKMKLASPIYHVLELQGVKAFYDREELDLGDHIPQTIEDAMRSARIHIAIFSPSYAGSTWCLAELSFMLKTGAPIIPIFYDVEPAKLKWGAMKLYGEAFLEYEKSQRYKPKTLEKWKMALHKASCFGGYEFKSDGDLGLLLKDVVNRVQQEIKNEKVPWKADTYPVGLDHAVRDFDNTIGSIPANVQIVGIVGMGGCGKTTLATELYNRKYKAFDNCSFLSEVREANLAELQKKLMEDILHLRKIQMKDASKFISILTRHFRSSSPRVLIVLDDVDQEDQLDALLPDRGATLGSGSLIIVTTRDAGVLRKWDIFTVYNMRELDPHHAKELFCWHAFKGLSAPDAFKGLIESFVHACHGLPLSLKVIAKRLYREPDEKWKSELEKISELLPDKIKERLRLSYDALDSHEKNIFLDVACFFVGEKKNLAIAVWDAAGWRGLESLVDKCLVEIDKQNRIRMHNHLRDLGREIAAECPLHRLWSPNQISNIMRYTKEIRGIMAARTQFVPCSAYDEFPICCHTYQPRFEECMDPRFWIGLRLLVVAENYFTSNFELSINNLVWLRWFDFQHTELPSWLSFKELRVLELYGASKLQLWENNTHPPKELREMIITARKGDIFNRFPSKLLGLEHLTKMALISYYGEEFRFETLPDEFCDLQSLEHLELRHCKFLSRLPDRFGQLRKLQHLDLCCCKTLRKLPDSFKELVKLEHLDLSGCEKLGPMPDILLNIRHLKNLHLSGCPKMQELPLQIAKQESLRELHLKNTMLIDVPNNIDQLSKLETLLIGSPHLTGFPTSLGNLSSLTRLEITECKKLESLPESVERLKLLEYLSIESCNEMRSLPEGLRRLANLQCLKIIDCPITELDFGLGFSSSLCKLKLIELKGTAVTRISISRDCCPNLETLKLKQNDSLMEFEIVPKSVKVYESRKRKRKCMDGHAEQQKLYSGPYKP